LLVATRYIVVGFAAAAGAGFFFAPVLADQELQKTFLRLVERLRNVLVPVALWVLFRLTTGKHKLAVRYPVTADRTAYATTPTVEFEVKSEGWGEPAREREVERVHSGREDDHGHGKIRGVQFRGPVLRAPGREPS